jgi:hypothetical protein
MKTCTKCKVEKPIEAFRMRNDGYYNSWCQECKVQHNRQNRTLYNNKLNNKIPSGVYMITCLINNKRYVGESNHPDRRRREHFYSFSYGDHISNKNLRKDISEFGLTNFKFELLESTINHKEREIYWINKLKPEYNEY